MRKPHCLGKDIFQTANQVPLRTLPQTLFTFNKCLQSFINQKVVPIKFIILKAKSKARQNATKGEFILEVVATFPFSCVDADWIRSLYESIEVLSVSRFFNEIIDPVNNDDDHDASCSTSTTGSQQHLSCTPHWTHPL